MAEQRTIAYVTSGIFGYLYRFFPIGRELLRNGHRVVVVTASSSAAEHAAAEGFDVRHLEGDEAAFANVPTAQWSGPAARVLSRVPGLWLGPRKAARTAWTEHARVLADTAELSDVLAALAPDLVLTEAEEHRSIRVALGRGDDVMLFEDLYSTRPGRDVPYPSRSHQIPDGSAKSRVAAALGWRRFFLVEALRRRVEAWWVDGNDWFSTIEAIWPEATARVQVSRRYLQFFDYAGLPRIRTTAKELAFPGEPERPTVVGPVIDTARVVHDVDAGFDERWKQAVTDRQEGRRIVFVSLGTYLAGIETMTRTVFDAVAALDDVTVIASVGNDREAWVDADLPSNVAVFGRVPQLDVLGECDLVVSTGGLNTGHEAIWFGVPILNLPVAGLDTPGNSARLAFHGVGKRIEPGSIDIESVRLAAEQLLSDGAYAQRAADIGDSLRRYDPVASAVRQIEHQMTSGH